jgi:glycosyltransferase involved in cell wall biosynthesis
MRVALDATPLTLSSGGLRRYTGELSVALAREFPADDFVLLSDQDFPMPAGGLSNLRQGSPPRGWMERRWWLWGVQREMSRLGAHVFHGTDFAVPYLPRRPSVLSLHDLSPWMNPAWHSGANRVRRRTPVLLGLQVATMVLTGSDAVRSQAIGMFGLHPSRIVTVPDAASEMFRPTPAGRDGRPPYFLFVGTLEPRKNIPALVEAWREVRKAHRVDLVLAGRRRADFRELAPEDGLKVLGEVADAELPALYSGATAVVYPSWYEGFGLPVLEAMQCGACVIASTDPALREVAAGTALEVPPGDVRGLAEAMAAVVVQPEMVAGLRERALVRARSFSWSRAARLTREVYEEAQRRFG